MSWVTGILVYVLVWWVVFFAILPWGIRRAADDRSGKSGAGHDGGAPANPALIRKALVTTLISIILFAIIWWVIENGYLDRMINTDG